jgi:hypothetical protein
MVFTIKERQEFGSPTFINLTNLFLRVCQVILAAAAIGLYAPRVADRDWWQLHGNLVSTDATYSSIYLDIGAANMASAFGRSWLKQ